MREEYLERLFDDFHSAEYHNGKQKDEYFNFLTISYSCGYICIEFVKAILDVHATDPSVFHAKGGLKWPMKSVILQIPDVASGSVIDPILDQLLQMNDTEVFFLFSHIAS